MSVNPADVKRRGTAFDGDRPQPIGYDAVGSVLAVGPGVPLLRRGDQGVSAPVTSDGSNAQFQAVDERIVGRKPRRLVRCASRSDAADQPHRVGGAVDRFGVTRQSSGTLVVVGGAGGVGSVLIQLAKKLSRLSVVATASRPESSQFVRSLGADHVVDHSGDLAAAVLDVAPEGSDSFSAPTAQPTSPYARIAKPFSAMVPHRRRPGRRHHAVDAQKRVLALGVDVHPSRVRFPGHGPAAADPQPRRRPS